MVNAFRWMIFVIGLAVIIDSIMVISADNPTIKIYSPSNGDTFYTETITVTGGVNRGKNGEAVVSVTVNGELADGTTCWHKVISLQPGSNPITAVAMDRSGNRSPPTTIYVKYETPTNGQPPTLTPTHTPTLNGDQKPTPTPTPTPTGSISITTIPPGADVYLDTSLIGITKITRNVTEGWHKVKVIEEGYHNEPPRDIYVWADKTKELEIELNPLTGSIIVTSTPDKASVYLDNVDMKAKTTCMLSGVVVGNHTIKLIKSDYFDVVITNVSVSNSCKLTELHVNLTGYGYINISSNPSGAKVYLDGNDTEETTPKNISMVAQGNHTIKLTKFGYFNTTENVSVSVGETLSLNENLTGYGFLNISSNPSGACVYLDGDYKGITPLNIPKVVVGRYSLKLNKSGYADVEKTINVSVGKTTPPVHVPLSESLSFSGISSQLSKIFQSPIMVIIVTIIGVIGGIIYIINFILKNHRKREKKHRVPIQELQDVNQNPLKKYILKFIQYISERKKRNK